MFRTYKFLIFYSPFMLGFAIWCTKVLKAYMWYLDRMDLGVQTKETWFEGFAGKNRWVYSCSWRTAGEGEYKIIWRSKIHRYCRVTSFFPKLNFEVYVSAHTQTNIMILITNFFQYSLSGCVSSHNANICFAICLT